MSTGWYKFEFESDHYGVFLCHTPVGFVFGRHQSFHRRPFTIGHVPFHFTLSTDRALLIVPSE
jgi:hypothetical protein